MQAGTARRSRQKSRRAGQNCNIVNIPEIWSTDPKYGQHTRNMVNRPEIWSTDQKYGQQTKNMVNIPEILSPYWTGPTGLTELAGLTGLVWLTGQTGLTGQIYGKSEVMNH